MISFLVGIFFTVLSGFIGPRCKLVEPGGVSPGWRGLPIPYYECGVWGDTNRDIEQCVSGDIRIMPTMETSKKCWFDVVVIKTIVVLLDVVIWTGLVYIIIGKTKKRSR